jgi:hypothetical protein
MLKILMQMNKYSLIFAICSSCSLQFKYYYCMSYNPSRSQVSMFCQFVRLNEHVRPPVFSSLGAAGADLSSAEKCIVPAKG